MNIEELLRILFNNKAEEVAKAKKELEATGLCPPPSFVKIMHEIGLATHNDNMVLLTAVLKELRDLRTVVDELKAKRNENHQTN